MSRNRRVSYNEPVGGNGVYYVVLQNATKGVTMDTQKEVKEAKFCKRCAGVILNRAHPMAFYCDECLPIVQSEQLRSVRL